jgi:hypothetical protein
MPKFYLERDGGPDGEPKYPHLPYVIYATGNSEEPRVYCARFDDAQRIVDDWNKT